MQNFAHASVCVCACVCVCKTLGFWKVGRKITVYLNSNECFMNSFFSFLWKIGENCMVFYKYNFLPLVDSYAYYMDM